MPKKLANELGGCTLHDNSDESEAVAVSRVTPDDQDIARDVAENQQLSRTTRGAVPPPVPKIISCSRGSLVFLCAFCDDTGFDDVINIFSYLNIFFFCCPAYFF